MAIRELEQEVLLFPDEATLDFPEPDLVNLHDGYIVEDWLASNPEMTWDECLDKMGAMAAVHAHRIQPGIFVAVTKIENLQRILESEGLSP